MHFRIILVCLALCAGVGCGPAGQSAAPSSATGDDGGVVRKQPGNGEIYKPVPLLWEGQVRDGVLWSAWVYQIIGIEVAPALLPGTQDVAEFCPSYHELKDVQKANFWAFVISAIVKYESGFDSKADNEMDDEADEGDGDGDGKPPRASAANKTRAQGLMHLSYGDAKKYAFCDFDENDKKRSIFDPLKNLDCGMKILATQIENVKNLVSENTRWKSLKPNGGKSRVREIQIATHALPFCQN